MTLTTYTKQLDKNIQGKENINFSFAYWNIMAWGVGVNSEKVIFGEKIVQSKNRAAHIQYTLSDLIFMNKS